MTAKKPRAWHQDKVVNVYMRAAAEVVDQYIFVADRAYELISLKEVHTNAGSDGGAVTLQLTKSSDGGAGTNMLASGLNLKSAINTVQSGTLSATEANRLIAAGQRLMLDPTGTTTGYAGGVVTIVLRPVDGSAAS